MKEISETQRLRRREYQREYNKTYLAKKRLDPEWVAQRQQTAKRYYEANKEKILAYFHKWHAANREHFAEVTRAYRQSNPERQREKNLRWRKNNPDAKKAIEAKLGAQRGQGSDFPLAFIIQSRYVDSGPSAASELNPVERTYSPAQNNRRGS